MRNYRKQSGNIWVVIVIVAGILILGGLGYVLWNNLSADIDESDSVTGSTLVKVEGDMILNPYEPQSTGYLSVNSWGIKVYLGDNAKKVKYRIDYTQGDLMGDFTYDSTLIPIVPSRYLSSESSCEIGLSMYRGKEAPAEGWQYAQVDGYYYVVTGSPYSCDIEQDAAILDSIITNFTVDNIETL